MIQPKILQVPTTSIPIRVLEQSGSTCSQWKQLSFGHDMYIWLLIQRTKWSLWMGQFPHLLPNQGFKLQITSRDATSTTSHHSCSVILIHIYWSQRNCIRVISKLQQATIDSTSSCKHTKILHYNSCNVHRNDRNTLNCNNRICDHICGLNRNPWTSFRIMGEVQYFNPFLFVKFLVSFYNSI